LAMANDGSHQIRRIYVDPRQNRVLGEIPEPNFFTVVLAIHRRLLAGTPGRVLTELTTGWTIAITLIGIILWWPRSWRRLSGILVPRLSGKRYVQLRDLHSIGGTAISSIVIVISITGLLYALVWGGLFQVTGFLSGQFDVVLDPPQSLSDTSQDEISVDDVVTRLRELSLPTARVSIAMGQIESDPITIESGQHWGPSVTRLVHLDRRSGEILANQRLSNLPPMAIYTQWNYPLHVGSIAGLTTKIIWIVAAIGLALLPILGIAMWLTRRRPGKTGVPKRTEAVHPGWLKAIIALLAISLPTVGLSMLAVAAVGWYRQHRQNRSNSLSG
ncbi:MAG: PepSY domain-containing protein, partial [Planctomycetota bacterium]